MPVDTNSKEYFDFKTVKEQASVPVILAELKLLDDLTQSGNELVGWCMLGDIKHGKKDSFSFNVEKKVFKCFACKTRGSILDFVAKHEKGGCSLRDAAKIITTIMESARHKAGSDADDDTMIKVVVDNNKAKAGSDDKCKKDKEQVKNEHIKLVQVNAKNTDEPLKTADLQNAVMSWSLAEYRVRDGKLNPDELAVVDVSTLEFLRQLIHSA